MEIKHDYLGYPLCKHEVPAHGQGDIETLFRTGVNPDCIPCSTGEWPECGCPADAHVYNKCPKGDFPCCFDKTCGHTLSDLVGEYLNPGSYEVGNPNKVLVVAGRIKNGELTHLMMDPGYVEGLTDEVPC